MKLKKNLLLLFIVFLANCNDDDKTHSDQLYTVNTTATFIEKTDLSITNNVKITVFPNDEYNGNYIIRSGFGKPELRDDVSAIFTDNQGNEIDFTKGHVFSENEISIRVQYIFKNSDSNTIEGFSYFLKRENSESPNGGVFGTKILYSN